MLLRRASVVLLSSGGSRHVLFFSAQLPILKHVKRDSDANVVQSAGL